MFTIRNETDLLGTGTRKNGRSFFRWFRYFLEAEFDPAVLGLYADVRGHVDAVTKILFDGSGCPRRRGVLTYVDAELARGIGAEGDKFAADLEEG